MAVCAFSYSVSAFCSKATDAAAGRAVETFVKEQMKKELADFVNANPQVVFSTDAQIGTKGLTFVSKALAVYGFLNPKSDRERAWSATYFVVSPEPMTAALLIAAQLADTVLSLRLDVGSTN